MDQEQFSEDLFPETEESNTSNQKLSTENGNAEENLPDRETFEEPLRLMPDTNEMETPDLFSEPVQEDMEEQEIDEEQTEDVELETLDENDEDIVEEAEEDSEEPIKKTLELRQADFGEKSNKESQPKKSSDPVTLKMINLPLGRVKNIMKLDPDVKLMSSEAIALVTKATELFIESLTKECMIHKDPKKKTIQKRDVDQVFSSADALMFLEGSMDF